MKVFLSLILLFFCSACIQLGGEPQEQHYYLLTPQAQTQMDNQPVRDLFIRQVDFPVYLDRPQIVTRSMQNELEIATTERWGEPLQDNLLRVLKENLQRRLGQFDISNYPWQPASENGLLLKLTVNQFDGILGHQTNVDIRWTLSDSDSQQILARQHFVAKLPIGNSFSDLVSGLSRAVEQLSADIGRELKAASLKSAAHT